MMIGSVEVFDGNSDDVAHEYCNDDNGQVGYIQARNYGNIVKNVDECAKVCNTNLQER